MYRRLDCGAWPYSILSFFGPFLLLFVEILSVVVCPDRQFDVYILFKMADALKLVENRAHSVLCLETCILVSTYVTSKRSNATA